MRIRLDESLAYILERNARSVPNYPVAIFGDKRLMWGEFDKRANQLAHALLEMGIRKGDRIGIMLYNDRCFEYLETTFAAWKIGAVPVDVNYRYLSSEIEYVVEDSDATTFVFQDEFTEQIKKADIKKVKNYICVGKNGLSDIPEYEELINRYSTDRPKIEYELKADDVATQTYSGGTTGFPKGFFWRNETYTKFFIYAAKSDFAQNLGDLFMNAPESLFKTIGSMISLPSIGRILSHDFIRKFVGYLPPAIVGKTTELAWPIISQFIPYFLGGRLRILAAGSLMHGWADIVAWTAESLGGAAVFLIGRSFDPEELWETVEKKKVNVVAVIGETQCVPMADVLDRKHYDLSSLMVIMTSGMYVSPDTKKRLHKHIPHMLFGESFAGTETVTTNVAISTSGDEGIERSAFKITDSCQVWNDKNEPVKPGEEGEIAKLCLDGQPYEIYKKPEKTAETYRKIDGKIWIFTGDRATVDEKGRIIFIGRGSSCINTGGEKVYAEEVENIIEGHPKVKGAGVVGVPDKRWGEAVTAVIQLKEGEKATEDEIRDFCRDKIAGYKIPKRVIFVEKDLPRLITEELDKKKIKEIAEEKVLGKIR